MGSGVDFVSKAMILRDFDHGSWGQCPHSFFGIRGKFLTDKIPVMQAQNRAGI